MNSALSKMSAGHGFSVRHFSIAILVLLTFGFTACGDKEDIVDPESPTVPQINPSTPIGSEDYVEVPTDGATIAKGDLNISFAEQTFDKKTKVAVTKVAKGEIVGEDEASEFYQLMMPASNKKPITVSFQCDEPDDDIYVIAYTPSISKHLLDVVEYCPVICETTYDGGKYVATLPASQNGDIDEEIAISVGLGHRAVFSSSAGINKSRATRAIEGESEGKISWYFATDRKFETDNTSALTTTVDRINGYMHDAIKKIDQLGFKLTKPERRIPITLFKKTKQTAELWGVFKQHYADDTKSWFSIREDMLTDVNADQKDVKATIFHELLHYFQADYDQRVPFQKFRACNGDELLMYEAGGQWIEKFVYGKMPNINDKMKHFVKGLNDINGIYANLELAKSDILGIFDIGKARQCHGYGMASLWEYLAFELGDKAIVGLYDEWARDVSGWGMNNKTTYQTIKDFAKNKGSYLFSGGYESFLLQCANGKIAPDFSAFSFDSEQKMMMTSSTSLDFEGISYAYGFDAKEIFLRWTSAESLSGKALVITPQTKDLKTYVYADNKLVRNDPLTYPDSLVISGSELEKMRNDGVIVSHYYMLTTRYVGSEKPVNYGIKVELVNESFSVAPTQLDFTADGGTQSTFINYGSYSNYGAEVRPEGHGWCGVAAPGGPSGEIKVTVQPNNTNKQRECIVDCYVKPNSSSPDSEKVKMPVKITQEAGNSNGGMYHIVAYLTGRISANYTTKYQNGSVGTGTTTFDVDFYAETDIEYTGGTLQVQISDDDSTPETLSFSISNLTGDYTGSVAHNIKYERETGISFATKIVRDANNYTKLTMEISSLPVEAESIFKSDYDSGGTLWFIGSGENGLQNITFNYHWEEDTTDGMYGPVNGHRSGDATYSSDSNNRIALKFGFGRKSDSAAPSRVTPQKSFPKMPWNVAATPFGSTLPTHAEAAVQ